jgi:hypothetical protein
MQLIQCPRCGHENRPSVTATTCDRCGEDISLAVAPIPDGPFAFETLPRLGTPSAEAPTAAEPEPPTSAEPGPPAEAAEEPAERPGLATLLPRAVLAVLAIGLGVYASATVRLGNALTIDPYAAGSVAVLGAATAVAGLVLLLSASGGRRTQRLPAGVRLLGFLLAVVGTLVALALVSQPEPESPATRPPPAATVLPTFPLAPGPVRPGPIAPGMKRPGKDRGPHQPTDRRPRR